jgi:translation initiation factor 1 (eIF-1/SUI1)
VVKCRNKKQTILSGLDITKDPQTPTASDMLKKLKKKICSSNGHINEEEAYVLQGDHRQEIFAYLLSLGISKSQIIQSGTL